MAQEYKGIVAGISVNKENEIEPKFDAAIYKFIVGQNGHDLSFINQGRIIVANGFVIAEGVRAFFDNVIISTSGENGCVYVDIVVNHDEKLNDTATMFWSDTDLPETLHDEIGSIAGTYRMKVLEVHNGIGTPVNQIEYPYKATYADEARVITESLADGVTATTQDIADSSRAVSTTEFVHNLYDDAIKNVKRLSNINWINLDSPRSTVELEKNRVNFVQGHIQLSSAGLSDVGNMKIATLPAEYCPKEAIETAAGYSGTNQILYLNIATNGDISLGFTGNNTDLINIDTNIGYETP